MLIKRESSAQVAPKKFKKYFTTDVFIEHIRTDCVGYRTINDRENEKVQVKSWIKLHCITFSLYKMGANYCKRSG